MIRNRVAPMPLAKVKEQHLPGVFGEFEDVVGDAIARLSETNRPGRDEKIRFYRYLLDRVDAKKFGEMQDYHLSEGVVDPNADISKYIDPTIWFESKLSLAARIGLPTRAPMHILDIGTGPAHFPVVAEFYGHHVVGTDLPSRTTGVVENGHLYDALGDIYQVRRIPVAIEQFKPLPPFERRYDLVTAFLAAFNVDADKNPWTIDAWRFFIKDLRTAVLTENGEIFMSLANNKLSDEVWSYLSERAKFSNDKSKQIHIVDFSLFED